MSEIKTGASFIPQAYFKYVEELELVLNAEFMPDTQYRISNTYLEEDDHPQIEGARSLVVTLLDNYAMPFLRYRIGDLAAKVSISPSFPVESVSWGQCDTLLAQHGLQLPSVGEFQAQLIQLQLAFSLPVRNENRAHHLRSRNTRERYRVVRRLTWPPDKP